MKNSDIENDLIEALLLHYVEEMSCMVESLSSYNEILNKKRNSLLKDKSILLSKSKFMLLFKLKVKLTGLLLLIRRVVFCKTRSVAKVLKGKRDV